MMVMMKMCAMLFELNSENLKLFLYFVFLKKV